VAASRHGDVNLVRDVIDQFVQAEGGFAAHNGLGGARTHGEQVEVGSRRGVSPTIDAAREFLDLARFPQRRQVARREPSVGCRVCGERRRKLR
jgi:hypothetical protein